MQALKGKDKYQLWVFWLYKVWTNENPFSVLVTFMPCPWSQEVPCPQGTVYSSSFDTGSRPGFSELLSLTLKCLLAPKHINWASRSVSCRYINGAFYSMERIVNAMGENPDGTSWKSGRITSFFDTEKAVKAIKPEIMNSCWNELFRCCTWLNGIYDSQSRK